MVALIDGDGTPVRDRGSGPGGRRSCRGGAPWRCRACCEVGEMGE
jgi:hypothetical protein